MLQTTRRQLSAVSAAKSPVRAPACDEIDVLHKRCGIYTKPEVARQILDAVGWKDTANLVKFRLLEPAAGDGVFVIEAVRRLILCCRRRGVAPKLETIGSCIVAFEIHPEEAEKARQGVKDAMRALGVREAVCKALVRVWIFTGDFLLSRLSKVAFSHAVGNPPYVRWAKVPSKLRASYSQKLPRELIGGDLFIPFLDRALTQLRSNGRCGFLCSDRWRYMAFAQNFRTKWLPQLEIESEASLVAAKAYVRDVDAYPSILIGRRKVLKRPPIPAINTSKTIKTIKEYGFRIRVGPALGCTAAFVLDEDEDDVEREILYPWIDTSEIADGNIVWRSRHIIAMNSEDGKLIDLVKYPRALKRLERFKSELRRRSIVKNGAPWFRPIDRIRPSDWAPPKLLIPEIAKIPRLSIDRSGAIPSHGVYAIFAPNGKIDILYEQLLDGGLAISLEGLAPKIKGGYVRCYKRFLEQIVLR